VGMNLNTLQYKAIQKCCNEFPPYNKYMLIKNVTLNLLSVISYISHLVASITGSLWVFFWRCHESFILHNSFSLELCLCMRRQPPFTSLPDLHWQK
jgi:hypothetical protein